LVCFCALYSTFLSAQCVDRKVLWDRIIYLKDSSKSTTDQQLSELLQYEKRIQTCPYRFDSTHAYLLQRIGVMYLKRSDFLHAIQYTNHAIEIINSHKSRADINPKRLINCFFNLKVYYDSLKLINKRNEALDSCITHALNMKAIDVNVLYAMENRIRYFFSTGDYQRCINYASMAETAVRENGYGDIDVVGRILTWKINALILLRNYTASEIILQGKIDDYRRSHSTTYIGIMYSLLAKVAKEKGEFENSLLYYQKAFQNNLNNGFRADCSTALNNMGFLYFEKLHQPNTALSYYRKALSYADAMVSLVIFDNIANVYVQQGRYDSAQYYFQKSFDQIKPGINERDLLQHTQQYITTTFTDHISQLILDKADAYLTQFKEQKEKNILIEAIAVYKTADRLFEQIKGTQYETQSKLFWRSYTHRLYEHAIDACYLQRNTDDAFYFFEKSRAVLLNDQLNEQRWSEETDILKQSQLKKQILAKERELELLNKASPHYTELGKEIFNDRQESSKMQDQIKEKNPFYYQTFLDSNFISIGDVQRNILKDHVAIIEILAGDSAIYILAITQAKSYLNKIDKSLFDNLSSAFSIYLSKPDLLNKEYNSFMTTSNKLYQLLFQNIDLPPGRVIISPDGNYFPFEALITDSQPLTYFLENYAVSYTYSARYLLNSFNTSSSKLDNVFMGVAPLKFLGLPTLTGSDQSLKNVQKYFSSSTNYIGSNATKNNFLNEFYKYKVIQLYTHATDSGYGGEPVIYFADSALGLSDLLLEQKPASSLIVLSACQTASGKLYSGEGIFSFNRSFAALGIPSTVSNLWQANDQATYRLTELFYKYIAAGLTLDVALQKAKMELLKNNTADEYRLPCYWASAVLIGKTEMITVQKQVAWKWLVVLLLGSFIVLGLWKIRSRTNSHS